MVNYQYCDTFTALAYRLSLIVLAKSSNYFYGITGLLEGMKSGF